MAVMPLLGSPLLRRIQLHLDTRNIEAGVSKACRYDSNANPAYQEFAEHYGTRRNNQKQGQGLGGGLNVDKWVLPP
jgi:hypothetical protein